MKRTDISMAAFTLCALIATGCGKSESDPTTPVEPEPEPEVEFSLSALNGRWDCYTETWDLTKEGICTEIDPKTRLPIYGSDGKAIKITLEEYCKAFADAYNAKYGPTYTIQPEDVAVREIEQPGISNEDYSYFIFAGDETSGNNFELHACYDMGGIGFMNATTIGGEAKYYPETKTITVMDVSNSEKPRRMVLTLKSHSEEAVEISVIDEYPWPVSDFAGEHAYTVDCTTIYTGKKSLSGE